MIQKDEDLFDGPPHSRQLRPCLSEESRVRYSNTLATLGRLAFTCFINWRVWPPSLPISMFRQLLDIPSACFSHEDVQDSHYHPIVENISRGIFLQTDLDQLAAQFPVDGVPVSLLPNFDLSLLVKLSDLT
jgi:hypothetical protein